MEFSAIDEAYRRRIEVRLDDHVVEAHLEDYLHHFGVRLHHDGVVITAVELAAERTPWATCTDGALGARRLVGVALAEVADLDVWIGSRADQCVHVTDLVVIAAGAALRGADRTYEVLMTGIGHPERTATLHVDGAVWGSWVLEGFGGEIVDDARSGRFAGGSLERSGFSDLLATLDASDREPAAVLRRASMIGLGRAVDADSWPDASVGANPVGSCHTHRPEVVVLATRNRGSQRLTEQDPIGTPVRPVREWIR